MFDDVCWTLSDRHFLGAEGTLDDRLALPTEEEGDRPEGFISDKIQQNLEHGLEEHDYVEETMALDVTRATVYWRAQMREEGCVTYLSTTVSSKKLVNLPKVKLRNTPQVQRLVGCFGLTNFDNPPRQKCQTRAVPFHAKPPLLI